MTTAGIDQTRKAARWRRVAEVPGLPFDSFAALQSAVRDRSFNLGVDPLTAAEWSDRFIDGFNRGAIGALSILLVMAALSATVAAFWLSNYWLLLALPIQAATFYVSNPSFPFKKWVTAAGAISLIVFVDLLFNRMPTAATLLAYFGLTFASVRAAAFITTSAFRRALLRDESLFLNAYANRACTLRDTRKDRIYSL